MRNWLKVLPDVKTRLSYDRFIPSYDRIVTI